MSDNEGDRLKQIFGPKCANCGKLYLTAQPKCNALFDELIPQCDCVCPDDDCNPPCRPLFLGWPITYKSR